MNAARNAPVRASLVRVRANARAVKNVEKPVRLRAVRVTRNGVTRNGVTRNGVARNGVARDHAVLVHAMVNVMKPDRRHVARAMVARVTSARLAMATAEKMVRRIESHAVWNGAISDRLRMVRAMATGAISAPRIVVRETMIAAASARRMAPGRAMAVRAVAVRTNTACDGLRKVDRGISVRPGEVRGKWGLAMMLDATPVRRLAVPVTADVAKPARHLAVRAKTDRAALRKQIVIEMPAGDHR